MNHIPVFELEEIPGNITQKLKEYYEENNHRGILNDSFTRYPHLFDWDAMDPHDEISDWFGQRVDLMAVGYVMIHWEW